MNVLLPFAVCLATARSDFNKPLVKMSKGDVYGSQLSNDVTVFTQIPFAKPPVGKLRFQATLVHVCRYPGPIFENIYYILQYLGQPFLMLEAAGKFANRSAHGRGMFDYQSMISKNQAQISPAIDQMFWYFKEVNITYLHQPMSVDFPILVVNPTSKIWQGDIFAPFTWQAWALFFTLYASALALMIVIQPGTQIHQLYRLSFDQRNFKHYWTSNIQKTFIFIWVFIGSVYLKCYRIELLKNLVPVQQSVVPTLKINDVIDDIDNQRYILAVGDRERDVEFFEALDKEKDRKFKQLIRFGAEKLKHVKSSKSYVSETPGSMMLTYTVAHSIATSRLEYSRKHNLCPYRIEDLPHNTYVPLIFTNMNASIRRKIFQAGFAETELGIAQQIDRKYHVHRQADGCPVSENAVDTSDRALTLSIFKSLSTVVIIGYTSSILLLFCEWLSLVKH